MKQNKAIKKGKCTTSFCKRTPKGGRKHCDTCRKKLWRKANLAKDSYHNLKSSAQKRGIPFDLSFDEFVEFATPCKYLIAKGKTKDALTVGRINEFAELGYHGYRTDNIKPQPKGENSKQYHAVKKVLRYGYQNPQAARYEESRGLIPKEQEIF
jgi:hypothetical protein